MYVDTHGTGAAPDDEIARAITRGAGGGGDVGGGVTGCVCVCVNAGVLYFALFLARWALWLAGRFATVHSALPAAAPAQHHRCPSLITPCLPLLTSLHHHRV